MIHFPRLLTARLDVQLRQLTIAEAVDMAAIPLHRHETAVAALLNCVVAKASGPHAEPGRWTVQERTMVVAHYLASVSDEGGNFPVGDGRFLDYLHPAADNAPESVVAGSVGGNDWAVRQLSGDEALAVESICRTRFDWVAADMAARLRPLGSDEPPAPDATDSQHAYREWLTAQVTVVKALPESDFVELFALYRAGLKQLHHLFDVDFDAEGHIALGKEVGGRQMAPARFPVSACYSELAGYLGT